MPATAWISHDLKHWTPYTIAPQATAQIVHTPKGYIAYGSTSAGTDNNLSLYKPAIWQSDNGQTWHQVLGGSDGTASLAKGGRRLPASGTSCP